MPESRPPRPPAGYAHGTRAAGRSRCRRPSNRRWRAWTAPSAILALIGGAPTGLALDELAARLDIPKSSLHRILAALKFRKFVAQPETGGAYFLGTEMLATAFRFHEMLDLRALIHPLLVQLSGELNETTHMAVLDGPEIVYQDKIEVATHTIKLSSVIGGRNPAHATGVGKALLAWTYPTDEAVRAWAAQWEPLPRPTRRTVEVRCSAGRGTRPRARAGLCHRCRGERGRRPLRRRADLPRPAGAGGGASASPCSERAPRCGG